MTSTGQPFAHDVFISYSSHDQVTADAVCQALEVRGIRCWIAPRDVAPGSTWSGAIVRAIKGSRVVVLVLSGHANASDYVLQEVERAVSARVAIVTFRIENVDPSEHLELFLGVRHRQDAFSPPLASHMEQLAAAVRRFLPAPEPAQGSPAPAQQQAGAGATRDGGLSTRPRAAPHGQPDVAELLASAGRARSKGNDIEALSLYAAAAERGDAEAQLQMSIMYALGRGVARDDSVAARWCLAAAEQGNADAQHLLGLMFAEGRGVTQDDQAAARWYRAAANRGNVDAQAALGSMYAEGRGVEHDAAAAARWHRKAADGGHTEAQFNLGLAYARGRGVAQDYKEAAHWYRAAAESGNRYAQLQLGIAYVEGCGVVQDDATGARWLRAAADQGHPDSQNLLGHMYAGGRGVSRDWAAAVGWYRKAAEQGHASAQYSLGLAYAEGRGVTRDVAEARRWFREAAAQGYVDAQGQLEPSPAGKPPETAAGAGLSPPRVSAATVRSASAALDAVRPLIARLNERGHREDAAADVIEGWAGVEIALRAMIGGSSFSGQALVSDVRARGLLDYPHAHALLGFLAARDRATRNEYQVTTEDVRAARAAFTALELAVGDSAGSAVTAGSSQPEAPPKHSAVQAAVAELRSAVNQLRLPGRTPQPADIVAVWALTEAVLHAMGGDTSETGYFLIMEFRLRRELAYLDLPTGVLSALSDAHGRATKSGYQVTAEDVKVAQNTLAAIEQAAARHRASQGSR